MKNFMYAVIFALVVCLAPYDAQAGTLHLPETVFVGRIVELNINQMLLQAGDYSFVIGPVFVDSGTGEVPTSPASLQEGQLVQVEVARKGVDISNVKKITILKGERLQEAARQLALPPKE